MKIDIALFIASALAQSATPTASNSAAPTTIANNKLTECIQTNCSSLTGQIYVSCSARCAGVPFPDETQIARTNECEKTCPASNAEVCKQQCWAKYFLPGSEGDAFNGKATGDDGKGGKGKANSGVAAFGISAALVVLMIALL